MDGRQDDAAASRQLLDAIEQLRVLERRKREAPIGTPAFDALASQVEEQARLVFRMADAGTSPEADDEQGAGPSGSGPAGSGPGGHGGGLR